MRRVLIILVLFMTPLSSRVGAQEPPPDSPHHLADECLEEWSSTCGEVCGVCHLPESSSGGILVVDIHEAGDAALCSPCHSDKTDMAGGSEGGGFLLRGHGGSHPVGVPYEPAMSSASLVLDPQGPKLFCKRDETECLVACSTCHNPMGDEPSLLRVSNRGSALCLSCHQKESGVGSGGRLIFRSVGWNR